MEEYDMDTISLSVFSVCESHMNKKSNVSWAVASVGKEFGVEAKLTPP